MTYQQINSENFSKRHSLESSSSLNLYESYSASTKNKNNDMSSKITMSHASAQSRIFQSTQLPALQEDAEAASEASSYLNEKVEDSSILNKSEIQTEFYGNRATAPESGLILNVHTMNLLDLTKKLAITSHNLGEKIPTFSRLYETRKIFNETVKEEIIPIVVEVRKSVDKIYSIMSVLPSNSETIQVISWTSNALANFEFDLQALTDNTNASIVSSMKSTVMHEFAEELGSMMQPNTNENPLNNPVTVIKQLGETCSRFSETLWQTS